MFVPTLLFLFTADWSVYNSVCQFHLADGHPASNELLLMVLLVLLVFSFPLRSRVTSPKVKLGHDKLSQENRTNKMEEHFFRNKKKPSYMVCNINLIAPSFIHPLYRFCFISMQSNIIDWTKTNYSSIRQRQCGKRRKSCCNMNKKSEKKRKKSIQKRDFFPSIDSSKAKKCNVIQSSGKKYKFFYSFIYHMDDVCVCASCKKRYIAIGTNF